MGGGRGKKVEKRNKIPSSSVESPSRETVTCITRHDLERVSNGFFFVQSQSLGTQHGRNASNGSPPPNIRARIFTNPLRVSSTFEGGDRHYPGSRVEFDDPFREVSRALRGPNYSGISITGGSRNDPPAPLHSQLREEGGNGIQLII